ncbi:MAG: hypothetical protein UX88_C0001G0024 [Candidatus Woesebacteria bacterium GW2011_GWC2_47_16]|uniref:HicB-like antitoxin of toxin-antitoxin system domain-containing protein n=7 Tax=Candidatus Woeseibacteriota TaxID=1752722 RepID=A0A0G1SN89_9BACT|nr:MAG: hypothetical protein UX03_C0003G0027 [Candidatus Woesebacteria bacterium GW2011_GWE1_45_18]KKU25163.1 MAG: hypothetical protein UX34_C0002G0026 [Candidatus Woesebacteria bacterium GW2011_GWF1_46_13]KKU65364.1 MAG: hypothetical protein UX88_C0001G0024 [Candidatus Woesebacteria bacterium GW2011_GWC2_47_16]KKU70974.1 MAG: hypothetical protein UX95_C0008G0015 [Candidatus Woesebacteria bacterium GW2011_GWD1_47_21]OGM84389.1 MAG: hypothetical protein A2376_01775 [Candidatus Woesebacteria bact
MPNVLNFKVFIEQDNKGYFIASVPAIPGCHTQGKTYEEVLKRAKEAIRLCLEVAQEKREFKRQIDFDEPKDSSQFVGVA